MVLKKKANKAFDNSQQLLQAIIDTIEGAVYVKDTDGRYQFVNSAFCKNFGVNKNEIIGKDDNSVFTPETAAKLQENDKRIMQTKTAETVEESGEVRGKFVIYSTNKVPLINEDGEVYGICGVGFDITEQRNAEKALTISEEKYRGIVEISPDMMFLSERKTGKILDVNESVCKLLGYTKAEIIGTISGDRVVPLQKDDYKRSFEKLKKEGRYSGEFDVRKKDGSTITVEVRGVTFGENLLAIGRDITERKKAEEERDRLISELREALNKVKTLSGMIPICAYCHKIRDDKGYWTQVADYISKHSEAEFSHGFCPECAENFKKTYPEYFKKKDN